ncbi:beta-hexosaminidase [Elysia marginata]|uniref:beta-N-acetylhexosaminidase n=1 Tax=Elysia marginata TaxID=1093978 RepID=A0AAV4G690_9GAST|nr:beta-hexosaminidase [Elysia marginata]
MKLEEKIGQLFFVGAYYDKNGKIDEKTIDLVENKKVGGIVFFKGGPIQQAKATNKLQALSKVPLLVSMDGEWGVSMRLDSTFAYPWNMTMGAVKDNKLIEQAGYRIGVHSRRIGIHLNYAPVVDINSNPKNPIIGNRSFGEEKENVTIKASSFYKGMKRAGIFGSAKHFPGHGDSSQDSHKTLPTIEFSKERIYDTEAYPYKTLVQQGIESIMVAHLNIPSLEISPRTVPSSLSRNVVSNMLKNQMGYHGLILTDALNMIGATNFGASGEVDLTAFMAGNDVLLMSRDVQKGIDEIKQAYLKKKISRKRLAYSVKKVLKAKYKAGLNDYKPIVMENLYEDLNAKEDSLLYRKLLENAITVVKLEDSILPIHSLKDQKIGYLSMGKGKGSFFLNILKNYTSIKEISPNQSTEDIKREIADLTTVIVGVHIPNTSPWRSYQFTKNDIKKLNLLTNEKHVIIDVFSNPYILSDLDLEKFSGVVVSYQNSKTSQEKSAQIIFGALVAKGQLPVSINRTYKQGHSILTQNLNRLQYTSPEEVGIAAEKLHKIDSITLDAIEKKMMPGCQILISKKGKIFYNKTFGYHTYKQQKKVKKTDLYDLASLTKILGTLPIIIHLTDTKVIHLDSKLKSLIPELRGTNKENINILELLSHYAQLQAWIPFYKETLNKYHKPSKHFYKKKPSKRFKVEVSNNLYLKSHYNKTIFKAIADSELLKKKMYKYSDIGYYILKKYIEDYYHKSLEDINEPFFRALGANHTMYNPHSKIDLKNIPPTEEDNYYRYSTVKGYVHDAGAAMQGGVGGHAGLFSNANDVAKIMQLYLKSGSYGGHRYFSQTTFDKFNTCYFCEKGVRRGLGFDKPQLENQEGPTCGCLSMKSFGHSGFTGTYAWADPEEDLIYIFLSNRTYPSSENNDLLKHNIRTLIQEYAYEAIHSSNLQPLKTY